MENLDLRCAELGKGLSELPDVDDVLLTDSLSVLEEQGIYAYFLFLEAQRKAAGTNVGRKCLEFLQRTPAGAPLLGNGQVWSALQRLAGDLDSLLFARDLLRQTLVYGRYHAKARDAAKGSA